MARRLYSVLLALALPLIVARLFWRSRKEPGYRTHIGERFGRYRSPRPATPVIWVHAVSVGETRAAEPLIRALAAAHPQASFVLTHMTPGGRNAARQAYAGMIEAGRLSSVYLPYDLGFLVRRFLKRFRPSFGLLWETEVWPNLVAQCRRGEVPIALVNARLSARSAARGARFGRLMREAAEGLACAVAQSSADAERLHALGVRETIVTGNLKFDAEPDAALLEQGRQWRAQIGSRPVVVLASTRESDGRSEEGALLAALVQARLQHPVLARMLAVVVPRHPQRFEAVTDVASAFGLRTLRRSAAVPDAQTEVWIGDSMGELGAYYAMADLAFVGGSLLPLGAHNLIEACACGCGVLIGPHTFNFAQATDDAIAAGAAERVDDASALWAAVARLLEDETARLAMTQSALVFSQAHRGATQRTMEALAPLRAGLETPRP